MPACVTSDQNTKRVAMHCAATCTVSIGFDGVTSAALSFENEDAKRMLMRALMATVVEVMEKGEQGEALRG